MASNYIPIADTNFGSQLKNAVDGLQTNIQTLVNIQAWMVQAIDTAPDPDDYTAIENALGMTSGQGYGAAAKAELDSFLSKVTVNSSVTDVLAARNQLAAKYGVF